MDGEAGRTTLVRRPPGAAGGADPGAEAAFRDASPGADVAARAAGGEAIDAEEAERVLRRLARIEALDRGRAPAGVVLDELRELVREAEAWARAEGDGRAREAVTNLRKEAEGMS